MLQWIENNSVLFGVLGGVSLLTFMATLIAVPVVVSRIPNDYFTDRRRRKRANWLPDNAAAILIWVLVKNLLGAVLVLVGLLMLLTPGQGLLTMVLGIVLLNFPGKYRLERWLVSRRAVYRSINWWRRKRGRDPLLIPGLDD